MGEQPFRIDGDTIVTDELGIGTTTGAITSYRTSSNSFTSSDAYLSSGAQLQNKVDLGAPSGAEIKMGSNHNYFAVRSWGIPFCPDETFNYSNGPYGLMNKRCEAWPYYNPKKMVIRGGRMGGQVKNDQKPEHHIYMCFYSCSGYSGTYRNYPDELLGYIKLTFPIVAENSWSTTMAQETGTDGICYTSDGSNRMCFVLPKGHYWIVYRQSNEVYPGSGDIANDHLFRINSASQSNTATASMRPPWGIGSGSSTYGNIRCLKSTSANWQPTTSTFSVPTTITPADWIEHNGVDAYVGHWYPLHCFFTEPQGLVTAIDGENPTGTCNSTTNRTNCVTIGGTGTGLSVDLDYRNIGGSNTLFSITVNQPGWGYADNDSISIPTANDRNGYSALGFSVNGITN